MQQETEWPHEKMPPDAACALRERRQKLCWMILDEPTHVIWIKRKNIVRQQSISLRGSRFYQRSSLSSSYFLLRVPDLSAAGPEHMSDM